MAINRFTRATPLDFSNTPIYEPNWEFINQTLAAQQDFYDKGVQASELGIEAFGSADTKKAAEISDFRRSTMEDISNIYATQGIDAGNRALKTLTRKIQRDYTDPNSLVYNIEANAKTAKEFIASLEKWDVPAEYQDYMKQYASEAWKGTMDAQGNIRSFNKQPLPQYVDIVNRSLEIAKEISPQTLEAIYGIFTQTDADGNVYYYEDEERTIKLSPKQIATKLEDVLKQDQKLNSWLTTANKLDLFHSGITQNNWKDAMDEHNSVIQDKLDNLDVISDEQLRKDFPGKDPQEVRDALRLEYMDQLKRYGSYEDMIDDKKEEDIQRAAEGAGGIYSRNDKYIVRSRINQNANDLSKGKSAKEVSEEQRKRLFSTRPFTIESKAFQEMYDLGITDGENINLQSGVFKLSELTYDTLDTELGYMKKELDNEENWHASEKLKTLNKDYGLGLDPNNNPFTLQWTDQDGDGIKDTVKIVDPGSSNGNMRSASDLGLTGQKAIDYENAKTAYVNEVDLLQNKLFKHQNLETERTRYLNEVDKLWEAKLPEMRQEVKGKAGKVIDAIERTAQDKDLRQRVQSFAKAAKGKEIDDEDVLNAYMKIFKASDPKLDFVYAMVEGGYDQDSALDAYVNNPGAHPDFNQVTDAILSTRKNKFERGTFKEYVRDYNSTVTEETVMVALGNKDLTGDPVDIRKKEALFTKIVGDLDILLDQDAENIFFAKDASTLKTKGVDREVNKITFRSESEMKALRDRIGKADISKSTFHVMYDTRRGEPGWFYVVDLRDKDGNELGFEREKLRGDQNKLMFRIDRGDYGVISDQFGLNLESGNDLSTMANIEQQFKERSFATFDIPVGDSGDSIKIVARKNFNMVDNWRENGQDEPDMQKEYKVQIDGLDVAIKSDYDLMKAVNDLYYIKDAARALTLAGYSKDEMINQISQVGTIAKMFPGEQSRSALTRIVDKVVTQQETKYDQYFIPSGMSQQQQMDAIARVESHGSGGYEAVSSDGKAWGKYQFRHSSFKSKIAQHYGTSDLDEAKAKFLNDPAYQDQLMADTLEQHKKAATRVLNKLGINRDPNTLIHMIHFLGEQGTLDYLSNVMSAGSDYADKTFDAYNKRNDTVNVSVAQYAKIIRDFITGS